MSDELSSGIYFHSRFKAYLMRLWVSVVSIFSITLLMPICLWYQTKYLTKYKVIDGKRCYFDGKIKVMYLLYLLFLVVFTGMAFLFYFLLKKSGIYLFTHAPSFIVTALFSMVTTFFMVTTQEIYIQKSTHFVDEVKGKSGFHFKFWKMILKIVLTKLINMISLGLLYPITVVIKADYTYKRGYYDNIDLTYHFSLKKLYPRWLLDILLTIFTLGLYFPHALNLIDVKCHKNVHLLNK